MQYRIMAEAHGGVCECGEECWAEIEAGSAEEAMQKYAATDSQVKFHEPWNCWLWRARKLTAVAA